MKLCRHFRQALVVMCHLPKASGPGEAALHHPTTWQQHNCSLCAEQLDHFQSHASASAPFNVCSPLYSSTRYATCPWWQHLWHRFSQLLQLYHALLVGRSHVQSRQVSHRAHDRKYHAPLEAFAFIVPTSLSGRREDCREDCRGVLSNTAAVGPALRP